MTYKIIRLYVSDLLIVVTGIDGPKQVLDKYFQQVYIEKHLTNNLSEFYFKRQD